MVDHAANCPKLPWMINFFSTEEGRIPKQQLDAVFDEDRTRYMTKLNYQSKPLRKRLTSLFCTLGPKSSSVEDLERLIHLGMCVARLRMPFFTRTECTNVISNIRTAADNYSRKLGSMYPIGIALDLKGPEIRTGTLKDSAAKHLQLKEGHETVITSDPSYEEHVTEEMIYVDYQKINEIVEPGDRMFVGNQVALSAIEIVGSFIRCMVERAGSIADHAAVSLESSLLALPTVSEVEIQFAVEQNVDMILVSCVKDPNVVREVKRILGEEGQSIQVISKIEDAMGVKNIDQIVKESDGIFISRSDLEHIGPPEKLFLIQKMIIATCNKAGKPVIVAPQMLESMFNSPKPTRAEIMDVTNAVLDGADGILLSRETASGEYCCEALQTLSNLCKEAETAVHQRQVFLELTKENPWPFEPIYALAISAVEASMKCNAACIILLSTSGRTARVVARYRPRCPIIVITRIASVARKLRLFRAIEPIHFVPRPLVDWHQDVRRRVQFGITYGKYCNFVRTGDTIVVMNGNRAGSGFTNTVSIYYASEFDTTAGVATSCF